MSSAQISAETPLTQGSVPTTPTDGPALPIPAQAPHLEEIPAFEGVVTVVVGEDRKELDIEEEVLRRVPFFNGALDNQGQAIHKLIYLPNEHSDVVYALLEFIYKWPSRYRYNATYQSEKYRQDAVDLGIVPSKDCLETLFHLQVFVLAEKIGYRELASYSIECTKIKRLDSIEKLMVWRIWYKIGGRQDVAAKVFAAQGVPAVRAWVNEVLEKYPEAMKSLIRDVPTLAFELLKASALGN